MLTWMSTVYPCDSTTFCAKPSVFLLYFNLFHTMPSSLMLREKCMPRTKSFMQFQYYKRHDAVRYRLKHTQPGTASSTIRQWNKHLGQQMLVGGEKTMVRCWRTLLSAPNSHSWTSFFAWNGWWVLYSHFLHESERKKIFNNNEQLVALKE